MTHPASVLAHARDLPDGDPWAGLLILHGAGSCKENHADMGRAAADAGLAVVRVDLRGHGETGGRLDGHMLDDVAGAAALLPGGLPLVLRGSSLGGYLALVAAARAGAAAVVAICPATGEQLAEGVRAGKLRGEHDPAAAELFAAYGLDAAVEALDVPVLIQHAEGDESVPVESSRALAPLLRHPASRVQLARGGDHRSLQHDATAQAAVLTWLRAALSGPPAPAPGRSRGA